MAPSATLTASHHRKAELLAEATARAVATEARKAPAGDIDGWWDSRGPAIERTVATGFRAATGLAGQYLTEAAALAGFPALEPVAAALELAQLATALRVTGPVGFKQAMAERGDPDLARRVMADRMAGTAFRLVRLGDRDTMFSTADANPTVIIGYKRVAEAGACKFCLMLESRGAVYLSRESAGSVVGRNGRPRGGRPLGRAFHDHCRCRIEELWGQPDGRQVSQAGAPPPPPSVEAAGTGLSAPVPVEPDTGSGFAIIEQARARADRLRRKANVDRIRAEAARERAARLAGEREAAGAAGKVDPELLARYGVTEAQYLNARALTKQIKADIRAVAKQEADEANRWLFNNELDQITRPTRLQQGTNVAGARVFRRTESGYDWLEQLDEQELRQVRRRMTDSDLHTPDVLADRIRRKTETDMGDDEAHLWLMERWLHEDALKSLASGRLPKYVDPASIIPGDYALDGYDLARLFGVDDADAIGHVAQVQAGQATQYAQRTLGRPSAGPAPWELDTVDYVAELEEVEDILARTQVAPGIDPGDDYRWAQARIRELVPQDLDTAGATSAEELHEAIRVTAQLAGYLPVV